MSQTNLPVKAAVVTMKQFLETKIKPRLKDMLPKSLDPDRFIKICISAIYRNPKLAECDPASFAVAIGEACEIGLYPSSAAGLGHFVPFKKKVKFITDYKGEVQLMLRHPNVSDVYAEIVHDWDHFEMEDGVYRDLKHRKDWFKADDESRSIGAYAVAVKADGNRAFLFVPRWKILKIRDDFSRGYANAKQYQSNDNPWITNWQDMWKKTAVRQLKKWVEVEYDYAVFANREETPPDEKPDPETSAASEAIDADFVAYTEEAANESSKQAAQPQAPAAVSPAPTVPTQPTIVPPIPAEVAAADPQPVKSPGRPKNPPPDPELVSPAGKRGARKAANKPAEPAAPAEPQTPPIEVDPNDPALNF